MRSRHGLAWTTALALALASLPGSAVAGDEGARDYWVARHQDLQERHLALSLALSLAQRDYSRGRSSGHLRGKDKQNLVREMTRLEEEFRLLDQRLRDFPETARQAGALPGWFRDLEPTPAKPGATETASAGDRRAARHQARRVGQD